MRLFVCLSSPPLFIETFANLKTLLKIEYLLFSHERYKLFFSIPFYDNGYSGIGVIEYFNIPNE